LVAGYMPLCPGSPTTAGNGPKSTFLPKPLTRASAMSLDVFEHIRTRHPERLQEIERIRGSLALVLRADPHAVIDSRVFAVMTGIDEGELGKFLVELAGDGVLFPRFFWLCPTTKAEAEEAEAVEAFPLMIECGKCGQTHSFAVGDVAVGFLAS